MERCLKGVTEKLLYRLGLELRPVARGGPYARASLLGALDQVRRLGWQPRTCIDVGAAFGDFTLACSKVFSQAQYLLVEPLEEYKPFLDNVNAQLPSACYTLVAAAARDGSVDIHVHKDLEGSSLLRESEGPEVDGAKRTVRALTLDKLSRAYNALGPYLLKIDVQGAELEVLKGASEVLQGTEYVILETSLFRFFVEGPELDEVMGFMREKGFVPYDILDLKYRPLDHALSQLDISFVKETGIFRMQHIYATPEQRAAQNSRFLEAVSERRRKLRPPQRQRERAEGGV